MENKLLIGITSSIAAMHAPLIVRDFKKRGFQIKTILTPGAQRFVTKTLLEDLTNNPCVVDWNDGKGTMHIELARFSNLALVAPASANFIAKLALGIADNVLLTEMLAFQGRLIIAPAMNPSMYNHPTQVEYRKILTDRGVEIVDPIEGEMICGEVGKGKMATVDQIIRAVLKEGTKNSIFNGKKVLVSFGATRAYLDPVRYISNESSGKMGMELAKTLQARGATVIPVSCNVKSSFTNEIIVKSNEDYGAALDRFFPECDYFFSVAAVCDFASLNKKEKLPKTKLQLPSQGTDYIQACAQNKKSHQKIFGFSADTSNFIEVGKQKLKNKNIDGIFINPVTSENNVFGSDYNEGVLVTSSSELKAPRSTKKELSTWIIDQLETLWK